MSSVCVALLGRAVFGTLELFGARRVDGGRAFVRSFSRSFVLCSRPLRPSILERWQRPTFCEQVTQSCWTCGAESMVVSSCVSAQRRHGPSCRAGCFALPSRPRRLWQHFASNIAPVVRVPTRQGHFVRDCIDQARTWPAEGCLGLPAGVRVVMVDDLPSLDDATA